MVINLDYLLKFQTIFSVNIHLKILAKKKMLKCLVIQRKRVFLQSVYYHNVMVDFIVCKYLILCRLASFKVRLKQMKRLNY